MKSYLIIINIWIIQETILKFLSLFFIFNFISKNQQLNYN